MLPIDYAPVHVVIVGFLATAGAQLLLYFLRLAAARSRWDIDCILLASVRDPLWAIGVAVTLRLAVGAQVAAGTYGDMAARLLGAASQTAVILALAWGADRILQHLVLRGLSRAAQETESMLDDMLLPVMNTLLRPLVLGVALVFVLGALGVPVAGIALLVGGTSFILAFALQRILEDVFSGLSMLVDTPFTYGDILRLKDGSVVEVQQLGLRVTRLYNAHDHSVIAMPNRDLAGQQVANLTRPSPDMRMAIDVSVVLYARPEEVRERLLEAAAAHPWVLGDTDTKLPAMRRALGRHLWHHDLKAASRTVREERRIAAEGRVNHAIETLAVHLLEFASDAHRMEDRGFTRVQRDAVRSSLVTLDELVSAVQRRVAEWLLAIRYTYVSGRGGRLSPQAEQGLWEAVQWLRDRHPRLGPGVLADLDQVAAQHLQPVFQRADAYTALCSRLVDEAMASQSSECCLVGRLLDSEIFFRLTAQEALIREAGFGAGLAELGAGREASPGGIRDLDDVEEYMGIIREWNRKVKGLLRKAAVMRREFERGSGKLLDEGLLALRIWISEQLKETTPQWKYPRVSLTGFGDGLDFTLRFYVDNVLLSHFTRASSTANQLRLDIIGLMLDKDPPLALSTAQLEVAVASLHTPLDA